MDRISCCIRIAEILEITKHLPSQLTNTDRLGFFRPDLNYTHLILFLNKIKERGGRKETVWRGEFGTTTFTGQKVIVESQKFCFRVPAESNYHICLAAIEFWKEEYGEN